MAARVSPSVRLMFACDSAAFDGSEQKWVLKNPWSVVMLPEGAKFPFRLEDFWVYAQLSDGIGVFDLSVELSHVQDNGFRRTVGWSKSAKMDFPSGGQLLAFEVAFHLKKCHFDKLVYTSFG